MQSTLVPEDIDAARARAAQARILFLKPIEMQRHLKILEIGDQKIRMEIVAPSKMNLAKVHITFTNAGKAEAKTDWRKELIAKEFPAKKKKRKEIGFHAFK